MTAPLPAKLAFPFPDLPAPEGSVALARGIRWLRFPLPFALDHINVWLIEDRIDGRDGWTLVDTGIATEATRRNWAAHFESTLQGRPLLRVVVTHCHPDHVGNAAWLCDRFAVPLWMTHAEYVTGHAMGDQRAGFGTDAAVRLFRAHGLGPHAVGEMLAGGNRYRRGVPSLPLTYRRLLVGDRIEIGGHAWTVIPGYGHSPEHASLHCPEQGLLISGDMLLPKISTNVSVWPSEPDGNPLALFLGSLGRFDALPPDTLVLPSHGLPFRGIPLRVGQLRAHHDTRLGELLEAAADPVTAREAVPVMFRRELDLHQVFFAMGEAIAHLNYLWHAGRLQRLEAPGEPYRFVQ
jgi:glyoxylase-like metal-dependent hydrolase (beta-lactamase superfamily II)